MSGKAPMIASHNRTSRAIPDHDSLILKRYFLEWSRDRLAREQKILQWYTDSRV